MADKKVDLDDSNNEDKLSFWPLLLWTYVYRAILTQADMFKGRIVPNDRYNFDATVSLVNRMVILNGFVFSCTYIFDMDYKSNFIPV